MRAERHEGCRPSKHDMDEGHKRQAEIRRSARNLFGWSCSFQFIDNKETVSNTTLKHHIVLGVQNKANRCLNRLSWAGFETTNRDLRGKGRKVRRNVKRGSHISCHVAQRLSRAAACRAAQPDAWRARHCACNGEGKALCV